MQRPFRRRRPGRFLINAAAAADRRCFVIANETVVSSAGWNASRSTRNSRSGKLRDRKRRAFTTGGAANVRVYRRDREIRRLEQNDAILGCVPNRSKRKLSVQWQYAPIRFAILGTPTCQGTIGPLRNNKRLKINFRLYVSKNAKQVMIISYKIHQRIVLYNKIWLRLFSFYFFNII